MHKLILPMHAHEAVKICQETNIDSDIPRHLLTIDEAEILKKVVLHSVATAFANIV